MNISNKKRIPKNIKIPRGQTQINANRIILEEFINTFDSNSTLKLLDLPCGNQEFLKYFQLFFPKAQLIGADIIEPNLLENIQFHQMDLSQDFTLDENHKFDVITSISGIMMFGNTKNFIENCVARLKDDGLFIITNDNSATIKDRISYFFLGRFRMFGQVFHDYETLTELVLIQNLTRLLRTNGIRIEKIIYTSFYLKDIIFLPLALLVYPIQIIYLLFQKNSLPKKLILAKYSFKQMLLRNYIIVGKKAPPRMFQKNNPNHVA